MLQGEKSMALAQDRTVGSSVAVSVARAKEAAGVTSASRAILRS